MEDNTDSHQTYVELDGLHRVGERGQGHSLVGPFE